MYLVSSINGKDSLNFLRQYWVPVLHSIYHSLKGRVRLQSYTSVMTKGIGKFLSAVLIIAVKTYGDLISHKKNN